MFKVLTTLFVLSAAFCLSVSEASGQTTEFTYQGSFKDNGVEANGNYDLEFKLFNLISGGAQVGITLQRLNVPVAQGIFSVALDFGASPLPGADRFLDIAVRPTGGGTFTLLSPRQKLTSAPYSVKSLESQNADLAANATRLGGVAATQYVVTTDPRMTDPRPPTAGSADYIQNSLLPQASSNFNITGIGSANSFNSATQYNIGGSRVVSNPGTGNIFVGVGAGGQNNTGASNSFFGTDAGSQNTSGLVNAFFGNIAGQMNTSGSGNSFFGASAGRSNTTGNSNAFFGNGAGALNTTGFNNAFFGPIAGQNNTTGSANSFFGRNAGLGNTTGSNNSFFGELAGQSNGGGNSNAFFGGTSGSVNTGSSNAFFGRNSGFLNTTGGTNVFLGFNAGDANTTGSGNLIIGSSADVGANNLINAIAIGANSQVDQSNSLILGSINGVNGATSGIRVGIGTTAPETELHVRGPSNVEMQIESSDVGGRKWSVQASAGAANGRFEIVDRTLDINRFTILDDGNVGLGVTAPTARLHVAGNGLFSGNLTINGILTAALPPGSANYIQNQNAAPQAASNFNISGNGTAGGTLSSNIVNATTQYNIGGSRILSMAGSNNLFAGAGVAATGSNNSFFGSNAGNVNTTGTANSFFGRLAGAANTTGSENAYFGHGAGFSNITGSRNAFFGFNAGGESTGLNNTFVGYASGINSTTSTDNVFIGNRAGFNNTTGGGNTAVGSLAGDTNTSGAQHTIIGFNANVGANNLTNGTAVGSNALVTQSNSLVLGSISGINGAASDTNVGIGTTAPLDRLHVDGIIRVETLATLGSTSLCRNISNQIASCSSSLRYKTNIGRFENGLSFVKSLQPITFDWKAGGMKDVGFGAEDIAALDPRFVTYNASGEVEGVKYDRLSVAFVNAFKEQQAQIERQQKQLDEQRVQIQYLVRLVCSQTSDPTICRP